MIDNLTRNFTGPHAIEIRNLTKQYKDFRLEDLSFNVPDGFVCGFIGQNGAGKTTTLKLMLNMVIKDAGEIRLFDRPETDASVRDEIGVLLEQPFFQEDWNPAIVETVARSFYTRWDSTTYQRYLQRFGLDRQQKFKTLSRGMRMKLGLAIALSHDARLLLLDEPTVGLDPVARDEFMDILREYMTVEHRSIFFSTHMTDELEKIADYVVYIHQGRLVYSGIKDELTERFCLIRGGEGELPPAKRAGIIGLREYAGGFEGMIAVADIGGFPSGVVTEMVSLSDIMIHMNKKEVKTDAL
ncbi:MAG: ABC transporter ATP-binding protein [Lachnospiraceae bacterium]|jgi:ABC-2 type transport system ATP-binding protein|nr:ABC transporter ATP-binding protein [Lachnospiraceae bacterium]